MPMNKVLVQGGIELGQDGAQGTGIPSDFLSKLHSLNRASVRTCAFPEVTKFNGGTENWSPRS